jgi:Carboxypeptidase regulatory-like domain/TonB dependent receptor/TonB-dependent Receptor Plug Domain
MKRQVLCDLLVVAAIILAWVGLSPDAFAQTAQISGLVTDSSGASVPKANIIVVNKDKGVKRTTESNSEGYYIVPLLQPGNYMVTVQANGFQTVIRENVTLNVEQEARLDFKLQVGTFEQTVTVSSGTPLINTESATVSTVVDRQFAENLPLNGRSFNTLLQLTPGVTIVPSNSARPGQISVNGQRTNANSYQVDGVSVNFGSGGFGNLSQAGGGGTQAFNAYGGTSSLVSVDALQEFRVETSSYAPEFGRTPGGQVIISTRSGTNQFHGSAFDYFRNDVLDANDWFANAAGSPRAPERQNDFGGVFGGPILRDKTFFFFSYEGLRLRQPQAGIIQVPSLAWRASAIPAAAAILNAYPKPNANAPVSPDGNASPFTGVWSNQITTDVVSLRIDHTLNSRLSLFGRYNRSPSQNTSRSALVSSLSSVKDQEVSTTTLTAGVNWLISGNLSDSLRFNYSRQTASGINHLDNFGGATPPSPAALLPTGTSVDDSFATFNLVFLGNPLGSDLLSSLFLGLDGMNRVEQWNVVDDFAVTKGTHQLKFGADYRRLPVTQTGFKDSVNYLPVGPPVGPPNPAAQFASNATVSNVTNRVVQPASFYFQSFSAYAQDRWKIGRRLSLTYGVRWELNPSPSPEGGTVLAAWQNVDNLAQLAIAPAGTPVWKTTYGNFAPRVGLAWQVTEKGDLVVRGSWGIFYDLGTGPVANLGFDFPNVADFSSLFTTLGPFPVPVTNTASITPSLALNGPYVNLSSLAGFSPSLELPYSYQWNVAVEKSLWNKQTISLTYVGQVGRRLLRTEPIFKPNPNFQNSSFLLTRNADTSDYHALQLQFRRPLSQRVQALFNYTWSHSIDTNSDDTLGSVSHLAASVPGERGSSNFDVRHQFSGAVTYDVPGLKRNVLLSKLTENWSLDGIVQARSGFPLNIFTLAVAIPGNLAALGHTRPDLVTGVPIWIANASVPGGKRLNPAAIVLPTTPRQGTLGRNAFGGFGATQIDGSLGRRFVFTERLNLQFRADVFNVFNHPNFSTTDDSFGQFPGIAFGRARQMLNRGLGGVGGLNPLYQIGGPRSIQLSLKLAF